MRDTVLIHSLSSSMPANAARKLFDSNFPFISMDSVFVVFFYAFSQVNTACGNFMAFCRRKIGTFNLSFDM